MWVGWFVGLFVGAYLIYVCLVENAASIQVTCCDLDGLGWGCSKWKKKGMCYNSKVTRSPQTPLCSFMCIYIYSLYDFLVEPSSSYDPPPPFLVHHFVTTRAKEAY